jgi:hypothetical protein
VATQVLLTADTLAAALNAAPGGDVSDLGADSSWRYYIVEQ